MPQEPPETQGTPESESGLPFLDQSLELLWRGLPDTRRGPRRTLTLDQIAEQAIDLASTEGLEAVSMRRLARELGVGTMSLYRYVPDKSVLHDLMLDRVTAPSEAKLSNAGRHWREVLEIEARESRALYLRHPWVMQINWIRPVLGPGSVSSMELVVAGLQNLEMSDREKMMLVSIIDGYVVGTVRQEIQYEAAVGASGVSDQKFWEAQLPHLERAMASGDYPAMAAMDEDSYDAGWEETFEFGLTMLLDGIEREIDRRAPGRPE
ncbi:TetR/AcrR family transcriptional regulator [Bogoriella caseilytica]|uniref:TetR family transcriptional regulator n=1 Tax=Bogoriella caseilytica TaxID=56055 RepID=A0A3N2BE73_9MICO|nr:TetR/AcrR family transcriptional regulator [Bogoriella caseilytica]ROR73553.1 TetR family transcriptional regulator [Bogoriella caseilytica]